MFNANYPYASRMKAAIARNHYATRMKATIARLREDLQICKGSLHLATKEVETIRAEIHQSGLHEEWSYQKKPAHRRTSFITKAARANTPSGNKPHATANVRGTTAAGLHEERSHHDSDDDIPLSELKERTMKPAHRRTSTVTKAARAYPKKAAHRRTSAVKKEPGTTNMCSGNNHYSYKMRATIDALRDDLENCKTSLRSVMKEEDDLRSEIHQKNLHEFFSLRSDEYAWTVAAARHNKLLKTDYFPVDINGGPHDESEPYESEFLEAESN